MDIAVNKLTAFDMIEVCKEVRKDIAKTGYLCGRGHISSSLSAVEIMASIYYNQLSEIDKIKKYHAERPRVILSKGHAGLALYVVLDKMGILEKGYLDDFCNINGRLATHPVFRSASGVEMSSGSLGQGIGFACGVAYAGKMDNKKYHTFVIVGDGELQEGSNWEAMLFAAQQKLDNLTLIIDRNGLQISGEVESIISLNPLEDKLNSFGFQTLIVDGHNVQQLNDALSIDISGRPKAIIAKTVKGKGIKFMEGRNGWHGKGLTEDEYIQAIRELER